MRFAMIKDWKKIRVLCEPNLKASRNKIMLGLQKENQSAAAAATNPEYKERDIAVLCKRCLKPPKVARGTASFV